METVFEASQSPATAPDLQGSVLNLLSVPPCILSLKAAKAAKTFPLHLLLDTFFCTDWKYPEGS